MQRNSYGAAYGIFVTGTAKRQRQNDNGMVETRHKLKNNSLKRRILLTQEQDKEEQDQQDELRYEITVAS